MDSALIPTPLDVPALLRRHHLTPKKSLGQNFLMDPTAILRIVDAAEITKNTTVLEIGAGLGNLTRYLARAASQVTAVELDQNLLPILTDVLADEKNVQIIHGDMLKLDPAEIMQQDQYIVVANIPYYITSALIRHLLEARIKPARLVLTMQREVADRICAQPGDLSLLALSVQVYGYARSVARIPAGAFYPPPKVDSATLRVDLYPEPLIPADQLEVFFRLAKAGFGQKRKMLRRSLSSGLSWNLARTEALLHSVEIDPTRRAETLSLDEWRRLTNNYVQKQSAQ